MSQSNVAGQGQDVRLVVFDLGGVLVRIARNWVDACERAGVSLAADDPAAWGKHQQLLLRYESGELDESGYLRELPGCLPGVSVESVNRAFDAWLLGMYPGAAELIAELKRHGIATACLSNTNERHWRTIIQTDPQYTALAKLDHLFASHEMRVMKPNERAYRRVEESTGVRGGQILFFDDKEENVQAARAVGWRAERVDHFEQPVGQIRMYLTAHGVL
jgi:putative hydrolase of the HAD superfamily